MAELSVPDKLYLLALNRHQAANLLVLTSESIVYIMIAEVNNNTKAIIIQSSSLTYWLEI